MRARVFYRWLDSTGFPHIATRTTDELSVVRFARRRRDGARAYQWAIAHCPARPNRWCRGDSLSISIGRTGFVPVAVRFTSGDRA